MKNILKRIRKLPPLLFALVTLAALAYSIYQIADSPRWLVDDAYILFRYAENLAVHGELNWNPGENPTEGYTGIALVWLLAVGIKAGISPVILTHAIGILFYFLGAVILFLAFRGFNLASTVGLALYLTAPFYYIHAWSGLETTMFTTAIIFAIYCLTARRERLFIFSILFLSLVRPEGILLAVLLLPLFRPFRRRRILWYLIPFGVYFIWRWSYYGRFLPNTFYAKVAAETEEDTLGFLAKFASSYLRLPGLLALIYVSWESVRKHRLLVAAATFFTAACLITYLSSHLVMNYQYRFFVAFYALAILALGLILLRAERNARTVLLALVLIVPQLMINTDRSVISYSRLYASGHQQLLEDEHIPLGNYLREHVPPNEWLVVHKDAGSIPYHSKLKTVDFGRLNDEFLATGNPDREAVIDYFFERNPGAAVFTSTSYEMLEHGEEADAIKRSRGFNLNYTLVARYSCRRRKRYYEFLFLRRDLAAVLPPPSGFATGPQRGNKSYNSAPGTGEIVRLDSADRIWRFAEDADDPDLRISALKRLIRDYPDDHRVPEAMWETIVAREEPAARLEGLLDLVERFPDSDLAPKALFTIGFINAEELADTLSALESFTRLLETYPESDACETARWMVNAIKTGEDGQRD